MYPKRNYVYRLVTTGLRHPRTRAHRTTTTDSVFRALLFESLIDIPYHTIPHRLIVCILQKTRLFWTGARLVPLRSVQFSLADGKIPLVSLGSVHFIPHLSFIPQGYFLLLLSLHSKSTYYYIIRYGMVWCPRCIWSVLYCVIFFLRSLYSKVHTMASHF